VGLSFNNHISILQVRMAEACRKWTIYISLILIFKLDLVLSMTLLNNLALNLPVVATLFFNSEYISEPVL
jgi:hypothetical protein